MPDLYFNPHDIYPELPDKPLWIRAIIFPLNDINGNPERFVLMHENITEKKQAEEALRESEERLQSIFRVAPTGIGVVVDRVFSEVNQQICDITGYSQKELIGNSARILYPSQEEFEYVGQ